MRPHMLRTTTATPAMITRMIIITTTRTITTTNIAITSITTATPMLMTTNRPEQDTAPVMTESEAAALYRLMTWLSPSFPVGAFSYSSGIEWAVEASDITDAASLHGWLASMLTGGSGFFEAVLLAQIHRL